TGWEAAADGLDQLDNERAARGPVGFARGGDPVLADAPGDLDGDVPIVGEQGVEPPPLPVGEERRPPFALWRAWRASRRPCRR
ncbi:hypothetical protein, partial [Microbacterium sp.]|uniref:hypothetical protein n=1 Tax=Microbacterium sp. TaxID=51671 RepID=UPI00373692E4